MRRGILGSIAALAAGAGSAWGQAPQPLPPAGGPPAGVAPGGDVYPGPGYYGSPPGPITGPAPVIMPPTTFGPPGDPNGLGPTASLGPPPGPMYPPPGPYSAPLFQPPPPMPPAPGNGAGSGYGHAPLVWFGADYLLSFVSNQPIPYPLLTTSSPNQSGLLGNPTTIQLIPANSIKYSAISGFRMDAGFFGDLDRRFGFDLSAIYTERKGFGQQIGAHNPPSAPTPGTTTFVSVGIPVLARPFIDTVSGPSSLVVGSPALGVGSATFFTSTEMYTIDPSAVWNLYRSAPGSRCSFSLDFLMGYKFLQLTEDLSLQTITGLNGFTTTPIFITGPFGVPIQIGTQITPTPVPVGGVSTEAPASVSVLDRITATNRFNGGSFGLRGEVRYGMFTVTTAGKLALGNMHQVLEIQGSTAFSDPTVGQGSSFGGLYANSTNIGKFSEDQFALIPEFSVSVGINLTKWMSMYVGYNFLYINRVARPGNQLNPLIDSSTVPFSPNYGNFGSVPGTPKLFVQDDYWLNGVNFGFNFKY